MLIMREVLEVAESICSYMNNISICQTRALRIMRNMIRSPTLDIVISIIWKLTSVVIRSRINFDHAGWNYKGLEDWSLVTVYPKKYAHGFVVLCFVVVMQSFIMNSHEVFIHIHLGCFAGTGAIVRLPQCQWSKPDGYGKISQCITTTKHRKAKTVCIFLGIYCS